MLLKTPPKRRLTISLTPLIDMVFILLVFFMLASQFTQWQAYELPTISTHSDQSTSAESSADIEVIIALTNDNDIRLNATTLSNTQLITQLAAFKKKAEAKQVKLLIQVNSETEVMMQQNIDMLDTLQKEGYKNVSFSPEGQ